MFGPIRPPKAPPPPPPPIITRADAQAKAVGAAIRGYVDTVAASLRTELERADQTSQRLHQRIAALEEITRAQAETLGMLRRDLDKATAERPAIDTRADLTRRLRTLIRREGT